MIVVVVLIQNLMRVRKRLYTIVYNTVKFKFNNLNCFGPINRSLNMIQAADGLILRQT